MTVRMQFQVREQIDPPAFIFELEGTIDSERSLEKLTHYLTGSDKKHHVLVLRQIRYVNSCGFSELVLLNDTANRNGKTIYFVDLSDKVRAVILPMGGAQVLNLLHDEEAALLQIEKAFA